MVSLMADLSQDWRRLDQRIEVVSTQIEALAQDDNSCQRLMTVPDVGPIISSAVVAAIGNGAGFQQGRAFGAWLGLVPKQESTGDRTILGKTLQARQQVPADAVRASDARRSGAAPESGHAQSVALNRAGIQAASPQHAGDRARQQPRPHRLGGSRPRSRLPTKDRRQCRVTKRAQVHQGDGFT
jgi:Transposase IS116/IS110/IS902 family